MSGERDLTKMLATLTVSQRTGRFAFVTVPTFVDVQRIGIASCEAIIAEQEAITVVVPVALADEHNLSYDFEAAWLTLEVHSALDAVGLTAAVSTALADAGIPCNMLAGYYHDHLLVPADQANRAIQALSNLADANR